MSVSFRAGTERDTHIQGPFDAHHQNDRGKNGNADGDPGADFGQFFGERGVEVDSAFQHIGDAAQLGGHTGAGDHCRGCARSNQGAAVDHAGTITEDGLGDRLGQASSPPALTHR